MVSDGLFGTDTWFMTRSMSYFSVDIWLLFFHRIVLYSAPKKEKEKKKESCYVMHSERLNASGSL